MQKYSVVVDGDVVVEDLDLGHAKGVAAGIRRDKPNSDPKVVPHNPDNSNDGPAALKSMFQM